MVLLARPDHDRDRQACKRFGTPAQKRLSGHGFVLFGPGPAGPFAFSGGDNQDGGPWHFSPLFALRNICHAALRYMFAFGDFAYNIAIRSCCLKYRHSIDTGFAQVSIWPL